MSEFRRRLLIQLEQSKDGIKYPGLIAAWSAEGKSNTDADREILKDLTGNGYDLTLHNFNFDGINNNYSGYNLYNIMLDKYFPRNDPNVIRKALRYTSNKNNGNVYASFTSDLYTMYKIVIPLYKILVSNLKDNVLFKYKQNFGINFQSFKTIYLVNGINTIPSVEGEITETNKYITFYEFRYVELTDDLDVTIEFLPDVKNCLTFNAKLEYGVNRNMPILNDYTIICKRIIGNIQNACVLSKGGNGAFCFEIDLGCYSYVGFTKLSDYQSNLVSFQTKNYYNNIRIITGDYKDTNTIHLGLVRDNDLRTTNMIFYSAYLFNRSLPPEEIKAFVRKYIDKNYLLPNEIPHPAVYYDFTLKTNTSVNKEIAEDLSGNNNNNPLVNFKFDNTSGYISYPINFYNWVNAWELNGIVNILQSNKVILNVPESTYWKFNKKILDIYRKFSFKFKCDLKLDIRIVIAYYKLNLELLSFKNLKFQNYNPGINEFTTLNCINDVLEINDKLSHAQIEIMPPLNTPTTIEILPEESGALLFDGINNYIQLNSINKGFKTMFMLCLPLASNKILYDLRTENESNYAVFNDAALKAYIGRNTNDTYINNKLNNNILGLLLLNKTHLITVKTNEIINNNPYIGCNFYHDVTFMANMYLYKFLGFNEELNQELINYVINNYNLMNNIDHI